MNTVENNSGANLRPTVYWRLWLFDAVLVSAGVLYFLATQYGTYDFFGKALAMAFLPFIAVIILVGGAGSTIFALTKVLIEKRALKKPAALALLVGPALVVALPLVLLGAIRSPAHHFSYVCVGNAPASASEVQLTGYSTFLREEWLAVFHVDEKAFQAMVAQTQLAPADEFEFRDGLKRSSFVKTKLFKMVPVSGDLQCFKRVFKKAGEQEWGTVFALFNPATSTAVVFRERSD